MALKLYKNKIMPLIEAYDRGVVRVGKTLIEGTHCAITPTGRCVGCAMGAVFLGAHPIVPCPTTPDQASYVDDLVRVWRLAHETLPGDKVAWTAADVFYKIQDVNDEQYSLSSDVRVLGVNNYGDDDTYIVRNQRVSVDRIRKLITSENWADLPIHLAQPRTLPKAVLI